LAFDLILAQKEAIIHHIFTISITACEKIFNFTDADTVILSNPFLKTEISTIFLMLKIIYDDNASESIKKNKIAKILYGINDALFISTFAKFRIFDLFIDVVSNPEFYKMTGKYICLTEKYCLINKLYVYGGMCGLYAMNIYWFSIIMKKIYKQMVIPSFPQINTDKIAESILSWTMFATILPYVVNMRSYKTNFIYDIAGITALVFASNAYHRRKHAILSKHDDVLIANNVMVNGLKDDEKDASAEFFLNDSAIHLKSFLSLIAMGSDRGKTSAIIHGISFVGSQLYSFQHVQIASSNAYHMTVLTMSTAIPCLYDLIHIINLTHNRETQMPIIMTTAAIAIISVIKPLYKLNELVINFIVILQMWYISTAIMNVVSA
jgi:hypothetical protein